MVGTRWLKVTCEVFRIWSALISACLVLIIISLFLKLSAISIPCYDDVISDHNAESAMLSIPNNIELERFIDEEVLFKVRDSKIPCKEQTIPGKSRNGEATQIVLAKVHKAASSTVLNVLLRFAMSRGLNGLFPRKGKQLNQFGSEINQTNIMSLPRGQHYDILCNHLIFDYKEIAPYFPKSAVFVAIVRDPFKQFVSAFKYYYTRFEAPYLRRAVLQNPGDPIREFLNNPSAYDHRNPRQSYTNNRMSVDLGFPVDKLKGSNRRNSSKTAIKAFLRGLKETFDLFLMADFFDESMVLLRRRLHWQTRDVLYMPGNAFQVNVNTINDTMKHAWLLINHDDSDLKKMFKKWGSVDIALYDFVYREIFTKQIQAQGKDFYEEVSAFKELMRLVGEYCLSVSRRKDPLTVRPTRWWTSFTVTREACRLMGMSESIFYLARRLQNQRNRRASSEGFNTDGR